MIILFKIFNMYYFTPVKKANMDKSGFAMYFLIILTKIIY